MWQYSSCDIEYYRNGEKDDSTINYSVVLRDRYTLRKKNHSNALLFFLLLRVRQREFFPDCVGGRICLETKAPRSYLRVEPHQRRLSNATPTSNLFYHSHGKLRRSLAPGH